MKSTRKKVLAVLLCFALCLNWSVPAFATENAGETQPAEPTQTTESGASEISTEPSPVDLGGFTLRIRSGSFHNICNMTNPNKYDHVVQERIDAVSKAYNFRISTMSNNSNFDDYNTVVNVMLSGTTNVGHFIETTVSVGLVGAAAGYFQDLNTIDKSTGFDAADSTRFWQDVTKTATFEGKQFGVAFISGSTNFTLPADGAFWMFNVNAVQNGGYSAETIYKLVRDYQWTLDEATKIIEACHVPDSNGDGVPEVYGLGSYKTNIKYFLQLDGGQTVRKVNGKYALTVEDANVMSVLNWIRDVFVTQKIAAVLGAGAVRDAVRTGKCAFIQCAPDYLYRSNYAGTNEAEYVANVRIVPSPVGNNQIAKRTYINPMGNASVYVMPVTVTGETKTKAATAFAAIGKAVNSKTDRIDMMVETKRLNDANMIVMYENYILGNAAADLGYITATTGVSASDPISKIALSVAGGEMGPAEAIVANSADINSLINTYFENVSTPEVPEAPDNWSDEWVTMKKLPEVMEDGTVDLGGFTLRIRSGSFYGFMNATTGLNKYDEEIRDRINEVSQKYNFELVTTAGNADYSDYNTVVSEIQSGSKTIGHFVETTVPLGLAGVVGGYFQDLNTFDKSTGFDVTDETRFWQGMTNAAVFEGKQYGVALITKSQNFTTVSNGVFWFFNKNVLQKGGYSANAIYKLVREYKWTLEEATKIMEACYVPDANGDGQPEVYGLLSYKRQNKYYIQLDGGQTVSKVNGNYVFTATNDNVMSVLNWLKDVYVTKKLAITTGSGNVRTSVRDGKTVFAQAGPDYLTRAEFTGSNAEAYIANVGIVPSPVGSNQIKKKTYINPASNARIYVMPVTIKGNEKTWAATAFAAIAKAINSEDEQVDMLVETNRLNDADMIDMYENYIINNFVSDPGYVSESVGNSDSDPVSAMVLEVCSGTSEPQAAVEKYSGTMQSLLDIVYRNGSNIPSPTPTPAPITNLDGFTLRIRSSSFKYIIENQNPDKYDKVMQDRISAVANEYNFTIVATDGNANYNDYNTLIKAIKSGSTDIGHFVETSIPLGLAGAAAGYFRDLNTIDKATTGFDAKDSTRFWQDMTNAAVFENNQYGVALITQSTTLTPVSNGVFWMFNRNVVKQAGYSAETLYKLVRDYQWTLDEATKIMEACYVPDANGDGAPEVYGLVSYKRQHKYYIQLDGGQTVSKVNGRYTFTADESNVMSVLDWIREVYIQKKLAVTLGASSARTAVRDGKAAFLQCAPDYICRSEYAGSNEADYIANVGILPSPVGNNQIQKKVYINPTCNTTIFSMPATVIGEEQTKAATAFAAIAKSLNSKDEHVDMMIETNRLNDADMIDMYENYITKNFVADPGYITEIFSVSDRDLMAQMVLSVSSGSKDPSDAIATYRQDIKGIASWHFNEESGTWANGFCGAEDDGANVTWEMDYSGKLTISGSGDMANYSMESVSTLPPWVIYGPWIRSVVIKEGVTSIGNYAFYEMNMAVYPSANGNAVTSGATYEALTSIEIRKSVTSIGNYAFGNSSTLETVYYAGFAEEWNAIEIGSNNQSLLNANIIMLNGVIASGTCGAAGNKTNVVWELADGVLTISGNGAMADFMSDNQPWYNYIDEIYAIVIADGVTNVGNYAFIDSTALTNVTISKSVKIVGSHAFANCTALASVIIPSSVTSIGVNAFLNCDSLMTITIPANVTSIDCGAFGGIECEFVVETGNAYYHVSGNCLIETATNTLISGNSTSVIPNYVTSIGNRAFINCHAIKAISIPVGVTSIGDEAFHCCGSLVNVIIPEGVTSIGNQAFMYCGALTSINIPSSVTSIGALAFDGCKNLKSINLPEGLTIIGHGAFAYCSALTNITIPSSVISINGPAFRNCSALVSITIPKSVTNIADYAFDESFALKTVYYTGTEAEWNAITIGTYNDPLLNATIHYNYVTEEVPEERVESVGSVNATITAPEGGWKVGENTFKVEAEKACYVAVSYDGGKTFMRVPAIQDANGGYQFTAEDMDANTIVSVGHVGDVDGDGIVRARDARLALQAASGMTELGGLGQLSADLDGDGNIRAREARLMLQAASDMHTLDW